MLLTNAVNTEGRPLEIFVKDGKIAAVGQDLSALAAENETVVDAGGLTVLPAFVDLHCHWRTPGFEYKEDIETGSRAAAAGGYTFVNLMPNTKPVCSSAAQAVMVEQKAAEVGLCDANQTVSITENFDGVSIDHLKTLPASVKFITEDGHGVQDNATMARAFAICTQKDITVMSHAEDMEISPWDYRLAEDIETVRNCWLSEYYQTRLHMCHVSTRGALDAIRMAKLRGAPVTCEVTPHHLWFTNDTCDHRHTGLVHSLQGVGVGLHALHAQRLIISDLHLVAACHSLGGINELFVEAHDVLALGQGAVHKIGGQVAEVGVQTHAHRAASFHSFVQFVHVRHLGVLL